MSSELDSLQSIVNERIEHLYENWGSCISQVVLCREHARVNCDCVRH